MLHSGTLSKTKINAGENVEKRDPFHTGGRNINQHGHYGKQYGISQKFERSIIRANCPSTGSIHRKRNRFVKESIALLFTAVLFQQDRKGLNQVPSAETYKTQFYNSISRKRLIESCHLQQRRRNLISLC